jgi:Putative auto-transporter adhesin, head GIN domain
MKKYGLLTFIIALAVGFIVNSFYLRSPDSDKNEVGGETYKTEVREFSGFTKIEASGALNVVVVVGKDFKVELESAGPALAEIETESDGDTLKIYSKKDWSISRTEVAVRISLPKLAAIEISGNSNAVISNVKSENLSLRLNGVSSIKISGEAQNAVIIANGASKIEAENLKTKDVAVKIHGSSTAVINASNSLDANAYGSSNVLFVGNPKNVKKETSGASSVREK